MEQELIERIQQEITDKVREGHVLFIATGGSSIPIAVKVVNGLSTRTRKKLTFTLSDERYGKVGHKDSNWQQLLDNHVDLTHIEAIPVLHPSQHSRKEVANHFERSLKHALVEADHVVALFGVGADSHIAGMLPGSVAVKETARLVAHYDTPQFERITITPPVFRMINSAYVYAKGNEKKDAIESLDKELSFEKRPNQLLKWCGHYSIFFN